MGVAWSDAVLAETFRREHGKVLAALVADYRDLDLAEDALGEAVAQATSSWRVDGVPDRPGAWLLTTARRRVIDRVRRDATLRRKLTVLGATLEDEDPGVATATPVPDERLRLLFTCCHPALAPDVQVALTLRTVVGLSMREVARSFLVSESAMAQRLTRAKRKIRDARIPYRVPTGADLPERLDAVLLSIELVFNEAHTATSGGDLHRPDLAAEAIRLAELLLRAMPDEPEIEGLLALLLLTDARSATRVGDDGSLARLADQDRSRWDRDKIERGCTLVEVALAKGRLGRYQLRAAIAAVHAEAGAFEHTDWSQIAGLYAVLARLDPSPVVTLNRAVAVAHAESPERGLALVEEVADDLDGYHLLHATRGELLARCGRSAEAATELARAEKLTDNEVERRHLRARLTLVAGET